MNYIIKQHTTRGVFIMEIKQLEYFMAVCKELHFTRAAEHLNISQPALSQQIRILENEMGMPLFNRIGKQISITEAGKVLLNHGQNIFFEVEKVRNHLDDLQNLDTGRVNIGGFLTVVTHLLPSAILRYHYLYPGIKLSVLGLRSDEIYKQLIDRDLDLGILMQDVENKYENNLQSIPLFTEKLALAVPATHWLADKDSVSLQVLKETSNILFPRTYHTRQILDDYCYSLGFELHPFLEMTTMESIMTMIASGAGVSVLSTAYLKFKRFKNIKIIPIEGLAPIGNLHIYYSSDKYISRATNAFIDELLFSIQNSSSDLINP